MHRNSIIRLRKECALPVLDREINFGGIFNELPLKEITDHSAFTKLAYSKGLSVRMVLWLLKFVGYNVDIEHRAWKNIILYLVTHRHLWKLLR